ncbi:MAG: YifB family Mg chelatase-like AAA ATPase, partial [Chloroflexota bacterium]
GYKFPARRITVNLAPADLKKEGPAYDLPIAVSILVSSTQLQADLDGAVVLGELSLDGRLRHTHGVLPMVSLARSRGAARVYLPVEDAKEASLVTGIDIFPAESLAALSAHLRGEKPIDRFPSGVAWQEAARPHYEADLAHIKSQEHAKRALEVAAAGRHNILMCGPPGSGKTLLARCLPSILPQLTMDEAMEVTKIYSVSGLLARDTPLIRERPFRAPHYTISHAGLVGGGQWPRPGEISLSHQGVLFLDEFPEFGHGMLDALRQPLEDRTVTVSRAQGSVTFPANFMLAAAMNPCPCGYLGDPFKECRCSAAEITRYQKRLSGPLLDRIDIFVDVPHVDYEKLVQEGPAESSEQVRGRVDRTHRRQVERFRGMAATCNAAMGPREVKQFCGVEVTAQGLLRAAMDRHHLTARAFHRILKVARTIADLEDAEVLGAHHVAEALQYRPREASAS